MAAPWDSERVGATAGETAERRPGRGTRSRELEVDIEDGRGNTQVSHTACTCWLGTAVGAGGMVSSAVRVGAGEVDMVDGAGEVGTAVGAGAW